MFKFGNPIVLDGSGRIKTDSINEQRIELVLSRFDEWAKTNGKADKFSYAITKEQSNRSLVAFPAAGFAVTDDWHSSECWPHSCSSIRTRSTLAKSSQFSQLIWGTKHTNTTKSPIIIRGDLATFGTIPSKSAEWSTTTMLGTPLNGSSRTIWIPPANDLPKTLINQYSIKHIDIFSSM